MTLLDIVSLTLLDLRNISLVVTKLPLISLQLYLFYHALPQDTLESVMAALKLHVLTDDLIIVDNLLNLRGHVHADLVRLEALGLSLLSEAIDHGGCDGLTLLPGRD